MDSISKNNFKISLALSGGGFRATLFHLGVVRRLMELGLYKSIKTVSSASGGSILNGMIGLHFDNICDIRDFENYIEIPIKNFVTKNIRNRIILKKLIPKTYPGFIQLLDKFLFNSKKLSEMSKEVKCIFNSTDINQGMRWRFNQDNFGGFSHGYCFETDTVPISHAVYSSAGFPGLLLPLTIDKSRYKFVDYKTREQVNSLETIQLLDGGIYDNIGLSGLKSYLKKENSFLIVSDAIELFDKNKKKYNLLNQFIRTFFIIMDMKTHKDRTMIVNKLARIKNQKGGFVNSEYRGVLFLLKEHCSHYRDFESDSYYVPDTKHNIPNDLGFNQKYVSYLAKMRTDFNDFHKIEIDYLMYHGSSLLDVNLRKWHPEIYKELPNIPLMKPDYNDKKVNKILSRSHKHYLFNFLRHL